MIGYQSISEVIARGNFVGHVVGKALGVATILSLVVTKFGVFEPFGRQYLEMARITWGSSVALFTDVVIIY